MPSCNFHTQLLGFVFLNFPLDGDFFFPVPELRHEKSTISPAQALGTTGKADEDRCEVLAFQQRCAEPYEICNAGWEACVHVQAAVVSCRTAKH